MIQLVDQALGDLLKTEVPLEAGDVELSFDAPDRQWGSTLTQPTVNLFLWDIRRNAKQSRTGVATTSSADGTARSMAPGAIDLKYLVTAWGSGGPRDEHALLGDVLATLLSLREIGPAHLPEQLASRLSRPPRLTVGSDAGDNNQELWQALDGQLKPGIPLVVNLLVSPTGDLPVGPPTTSVEVQTHDRSDDQTHRSSRARSVVTES